MFISYDEFGTVYVAKDAYGSYFVRDSDYAYRFNTRDQAEMYCDPESMNAGVIECS